MAEDTLDRVERILDEVAERLNNVAREQELFAGEMRQLCASQEELQTSQSKTDEEIRELRSSQSKTDEQLKETANQAKKTEKGIDRLSREIGGGLGRAAEGLTAPCVPKVFKKLGIRVESVYQRVKALQDGQVKPEIDILCPARRNGSSLILVGEVKAHLTHEDVQDFFDDSLISFKKNFAEYKDRDVIAFVSGLNVEENAIRFAQKKGLYVLIPYGDTMRIANLPDFEPKVW